MQILFTSTARRNRNRTFGLGILKGRKPARPGLRHGRLPIGADPYDDAWAMGYFLGLENIDADPSSDLSEHCKTAFLDGLDKGRRQLDADRLEWSAMLEAKMDREVGRYEECETRGAWGGHADGPSFADDFYTALCSEGR